MRDLLLASLLIAAATLPMRTGAACAPAPDRSALQHFDAGQLERVLARSRARRSAGVIYVWSPHMPLSLIGLREIAAIAADMGIELVAVMDPHADAALVDAALAGCDAAPEHTARLLSAPLVARGLLNHYPGLIVFDAGALLGDGLLGYQPPRAVRRALTRRLGR